MVEYRRRRIEINDVRMFSKGYITKRYEYITVLERALYRALQAVDATQ